MVTGLISDLSTGEIVTNTSTPHISSYNFERYSVNILLDHVQLNLIDNKFGKMNKYLHCEKKYAYISQISSYMHHARIIAYINDHTLLSNVDIYCNNEKRHVDTDKTNTDYATIINEGYLSRPNADI